MISKDKFQITFNKYRALTEELNVTNSFEYFDECGLYFISFIDNEKGESCYSFKIVNKKKYLLAKLKYGI